MSKSQNYLAVDKNTHEVFRIYGCTQADEAKQFIDNERQILLVLTDQQLAALNLQVVE